MYNLILTSLLTIACTEGLTYARTDQDVPYGADFTETLAGVFDQEEDCFVACSSTPGCVQAATDVDTEVNLWSCLLKIVPSIAASNDKVLHKRTFTFEKGRFFIPKHLVEAAFYNVYQDKYYVIRGTRCWAFAGWNFSETPTDDYSVARIFDNWDNKAIDAIFTRHLQAWGRANIYIVSGSQVYLYVAETSNPEPTQSTGWPPGGMYIRDRFGSLAPLNIRAAVDIPGTTPLYTTWFLSDKTIHPSYYINHSTSSVNSSVLLEQFYAATSVGKPVNVSAMVGIYGTNKVVLFELNKWFLVDFSTRELLSSADINVSYDP